ncbi:cytochrome b561-like protein [Pseudomonas sp. SJZ101]|nr:cytochrome b561-like protein [Pseudomonas sp. SJZ075]TWC26712.1 cytochrome b561-like protein [Pseudomonas sp. SJZ078]TWC45831.1 cytochrome b561-like protein [Pseudomonas sp. SJZ124]TWC81154.1 cytochrome b561-like protein [Pseudomonas sp. SJZ101]
MMDRPIEIFGLLSIPQPLQDPALIEFFFITHRYGCVVLALFVIGHIGAVLLHALRGHNLLERMSLSSKSAA